MLLRKSFLLAPVLVSGLAASVALAALGLFAASCSGSATAGPPGDDSGTTATLLDAACVDGGLTIAFDPMYSAYEGAHTYQLPAIVVGSDQPVTWFVDSKLVGIMPDSEGPNEVLLTMLGSGTTTVHVQSADGKCGSAPLNISKALESDWEIGNKRYNDGTSLHLAGPAVAGSGSPLEMGGTVHPACTNCHGETATNSLYKDVSHTPEQTGGYSDADILNIVLNGTFPNGGMNFDWSIVPYPVWQNFHRWQDITTDEQQGIITYLRSLPPAKQKGQPNFGIYLDGGLATVVTEGGSGDDGGADVVVEASGAGTDSSGSDVGGRNYLAYMSVR
ncbi:MAG: hypothetical protein ACRENE_06655, partial [Polyangiaceae bacterium]